MAEPFRLTTADARFDPRQPVTVNGYLYLPADGAHASQPATPKHGKSVVLIERRRRVITANQGGPHEVDHHTPNSAGRAGQARADGPVTVARPDYAALGLGSAEEAEGRN